MTAEPDPTPIHSLMGSRPLGALGGAVLLCHPTAEAHAMLKGADVVLAVDVSDPTRRKVVKGEQHLRQVARPGRAEELRMLMVEMDIDTDELEWLAAAVRVACRSRG